MAKNNFIKSISKDFKFKLLCILAAFAMWVFVMEEIDPITVRSIKNAPISEITNLEEIENSGLTLSYNQNLVTNIDFRAKRSVLADYISDMPEIVGTIENPKKGLNDMILSVEVPNSINYSFDPLIIQVNLEESVVEERIVAYELLGNPIEGYEVLKTDLSENNIEIEGPRSQVNKVVKMMAPINVNDVKKDFESRVKVIPVDDKGNEVLGVKVKEYYVIANVNVSATKEVPIKFDIVDKDRNPIENLVFESEEKTIKIYGEKDVIENVESLYTVDINLEDINNHFTDMYLVDLQKISDISYENNSVRIIAKEDLVDYSFEYDKSNIMFTQSSELKEELLSYLPDKIKVSFKSAKEYNLTEDDIKLFIDNKDNSNKYELNLSINIPVLNTKISPNKIVF